MRVNVNGRGFIAGIGLLPQRNIELGETQIRRLFNFRNCKVYLAATGELLTPAYFDQKKKVEAEQVKKAATVEEKPIQIVVAATPVLEEVPVEIVTAEEPVITTEEKVAESATEVLPEIVEETPVEEAAVEETPAEEVVEEAPAVVETVEDVTVDVVEEVPVEEAETVEEAPVEEEEKPRNNSNRKRRNRH